MRSIYFSLTIVLLLLALCAKAQTKGAWYRYYDEKQERYGFKDNKGKIKIKPRFNGMISALEFNNIMAVTDAVSGKSYYRLKNGQKAGVDSLYVWDMTYDCEQEGKIRFRDPTTDKVGFLDKNGKVAIPARYNDAKPFYNGLALVIYGGKRVCPDGTPYDAEKCEHWVWTGTTALIDTAGNIVADHIDFERTLHLNWYACKLHTAPVTSGDYTSFKAVNGQYYSFIDYQKEFKNWFYHRFMIDVMASNSNPGYYKIVTVDNTAKGNIEKNYSKTDFMNKYLSVMKKKMAGIANGLVDTAILTSDLNNDKQSQREFKLYYTTCGEHNREKYPVFEVLTSRVNKRTNKLEQEHYEFLRTDLGYKLIAVVWHNTSK